MRRFLSAVLASTLAACGGGSSVDSPSETPPPPPPPPAQIANALIIQAGNNQQAAPGEAVTTVPTVQVVDRNGQPMAGVPVHFAVAAGAGALQGDSPTTGADGKASPTSWVLGSLPGENRLTATSGTLPPVNFTATARLLIPATTLTGTVTLPVGARLDRSLLRVVSGLTGAPVAGDGAFTALALPAKTQFGVVEAPNGQPVLLAWLDSDHRAFTVHTTAAVMAFFDLKAFIQPSEPARRIVREYLATQADLRELETAITAALAADPASVTLGTSAIRAARQHLAAQLRPAPTAGPARGMTIDPLNQEFSGIKLDQQGLNSILLTNNWRRRVVGFVDRLSYLPKGGGASVPAPLAGEKIELAGVTAASTIVGTFLDISAGKYAWVPVVGPPVSAPLYPSDARSTRYRVLVVGPGQASGVPLSEAQSEAQIEASERTLLLDLILPFVDLVVTAGGALEVLGDQGVEKLIREFFDANPAPTEIIVAMREGNWTEAFVGAEKLLFETERGQEFLLKNLFQPVAEAWGVSAKSFAGKFREWQKALFVVDAVATAIAIDQVWAAINDASQVVTWDVTATTAHVSLTPAHPTISTFALQPFQATVVEASGGPAPTFIYRWSTSGAFGTMCAADATPSCSKSLETPSNVARYVPDAVDGGTDQVRVEVFVQEGGQKTAIGDATAQITTVPPKVSITPQQLSLPPGGNGSFSASADALLLDGGTLTYRWSTPGAFGSLLLGMNNAESSLATMIYTAKTGVEGNETVSVEMYSTRNGVKRSVGRATATVKVETKPTVVQGRYFSEVHSMPNNRVCAGAYIAFPLVEGAHHYEMHAYNFNDPLFWGSDISLAIFLVSYPNPWGTCDVKGLISGRNGNEFVYMLTGGSGPASVFQGLGPTDARFAGIKIDVTVKYTP